MFCSLKISMLVVGPVLTHEMMHFLQMHYGTKEEEGKEVCMRNYNRLEQKENSAYGSKDDPYQGNEGWKY